MNLNEITKPGNESGESQDQGVVHQASPFDEDPMSLNRGRFFV